VLRVAFAVAVVAAFGVPVGSAGAYSVGTPVVASPVTSPFDPCAAQPDQDVDPDAPANFENTSVEPNVAVNPTNGANVIGVFQEDRWFDGGAHGLEPASPRTAEPTTAITGRHSARARATPTSPRARPIRG
jgi:hypothetical protein